MNTTNLKLSKTNKVEKGMIIREISIENKIILALNNSLKKSKSILKKISAGLEELGNGAGYALRR